jgi:hypothetical protein
MNTANAASDFAGELAFVLLVSLPLAFITSVGLLGLYRRAVVRGMQRRGYRAPALVHSGRRFSGTRGLHPLSVELRSTYHCQAG